MNGTYCSWPLAQHSSGCASICVLWHSPQAQNYPIILRLLLDNPHCPPWVKQQWQNCFKSVFQILANLIKQANSVEEIHLHLRLEQDVVFSGHFLAFAMSLPSFVSHPQFRMLNISNFHAPLNVIGNIVHAFLASPCSHKQTLKMSVNTSNRTTLSIPTNCWTSA